MSRLTPWLALAAVLAIGASYSAGRWQGYNNGYAASDAVHEEQRVETQQELFRLGDEMSRRAAELEALLSERADLVQSLEDAARAAPNAGNTGVGAGGLRRLEQRWGSP